MIRWNAPYGDAYWDMAGMYEGKRVVGHKFTAEEKTEYDHGLFCFISGIVQGDILWRYFDE